MEPYFFQGVVLQERVQLSLQLTLGFSHITSGVAGVAKVSIVPNQVAVWIESDHGFLRHVGFLLPYLPI